MKILFYVEPHGLRDSFTSHKMPFDQFRAIAREINYFGDEILQDVEARVFSNHFVSTVGFDANYEDWPFILQPTLAEQEMIEDAARMWMGQGIKDWITLMTEPQSPLTQAYVDILRRIKETEFDFDVIVCWGESMPVREAAREFGAQVAFFELASMRAPFLKSLLIDPMGVNGSASIADMEIGQLREILKPLHLRLLPMLLNEEMAIGVQNTVIPNALFHPMGQAMRAFFDRPGRKALVPLQLADDANQILYSDFDTVEAFAAATVEPLLQAGFHVILKPHPHALLRGGYVMNEQRKVIEKYRKQSEILVLEENSDPNEYLPMLKAVDLVVTNNSSVGFEALMLETPVVVMGRACYAPKGGLPSLTEAIRCFVDAELDAQFKQNRRYIATYMLACAFPLQRRLGLELVKRLKIWREHPQLEEFGWVREMLEGVAWDTWGQRDFLRKAIGVAV